MKVSVICGTRPEAIKLAPVILALQRDRRFSTQVCVTAQHRYMLDQALNIFGIVPDTDLNVMSRAQSLSKLTCRTLQRVSEYLKTHAPDLVLVQGDTTTVFATALAAFYQEIPIGHVEAGLRTGNLRSPWPEEANRVLTSQLATFHFAPTKRNAHNLLLAGIPPERIFVTGNTVIDALHLAIDRVRRKPPLVPQLSASLLADRTVPLVLITAHRRENFGEKLQSICRAISRLAACYPSVHFVYPVHLNPSVRATVAQTLGSSEASCSNASNIHLIEPLSYLPFVALMERATVILTDSGGIQEEAPSLGKPVLVMRDTTERPEVLEGGTVKLVGANPDDILRETSRLLDDAPHYQSMARVQTPFGDGTASHRIIDAIWSYFQTNQEQMPLTLHNVAFSSAVGVS